MNDPVSLVLTLRENARTPAAKQRVKQIAESLGMTPSSEGDATICCRVPEQAFKTIFRTTAKRRKSQKSGPADFGAPAGFAEMNLPVDASLQEWVEAVSVLPPAIRMHESL